MLAIVAVQNQLISTFSFCIAFFISVLMSWEFKHFSVYRVSKAFLGSLGAKVPMHAG